MYRSLALLGLSALTSAQSSGVAQVQEVPPPFVVLSTTKSGVIPSLPTGTPFAGVDTEQGAIVSPYPPLPGYTGLLGTATANTNQPAATYVATLPPTMFNPLVGTVIQGTVQAVGGPNGVTFTVNITNLPDQAKYGPFPWHIHNLAVPADGNCTATMGHFDPTNRGELYKCDATQPQTCQVGDLAGKHGGPIMTANTFTTTFTDPYLSVVQGSADFFGGLAFLLHTGNTSRMTCANFVQVGSGASTTGGSTGMNASSTAMYNMPSMTASNLPQVSSKAEKMGLGFGVLGAALLAAFL